MKGSPLFGNCFSGHTEYRVNLIFNRQTSQYRCRFATRTKSIRADKAISSQRLSLLTNCAEFAAHDKGNGKKPVNESMSCRRIGKKAFCLGWIESNPYRLIRWIAGWVGLVFLGSGLNDAVPNPRYPCMAKKKKVMPSLN